MAFARSALGALLVLLVSRAGLWAMWRLYWQTDALQTSAALFGAMIALDIVLLGLALRLVWRAARDQRGSGLGLGLYGVALASCAAVLTTALDHVARRAAPVPVTVPAPAGLAVRHGTVILSGPLDFASFDRLEQTLAQAPNVTKLSLDSDGGRIAAARGVAKLVMDARLQTHVDKRCASACTLVFIAGSRRTMGPRAKIGFHGYRLVSMVRTLDPDDEERRDAGFFRDRGVDPNFISRAFATPHYRIWYPDRTTLLGAGVLTE